MSKAKPELRSIGCDLPDGAKALFDNMLIKFAGKEPQVASIFGIVSIFGSMAGASYKSGMFSTTEFDALQDATARSVMAAGEAMGLSVAAVNEVVETYGEVMSFMVNGVKQ